jgi:hypothetical protein
MILMILRYYFLELGYQKVTVNVYSFMTKQEFERNNHFDMST